MCVIMKIKINNRGYVMITVSTDYSEKNREKYLTEQGAYFTGITVKTPFDTTDIEIINKIDGADILNGEDEIQGIFGRTNIDKISTGAKTLLNLRNILKKQDEAYVDIASCGDNAIDLLVRILKQYPSDKIIHLLTNITNYINFEPIDLYVDNKYRANNFAEVRRIENV